MAVLTMSPIVASHRQCQRMESEGEGEDEEEEEELWHRQRAESGTLGERKAWERGGNRWEGEGYDGLLRVEGEGKLGFGKASL